MDVRAIILIGGDTQPAQRLSGIPIAFLDVLGEPVLQRVLNRLGHFGVSATAVVTDVPISGAPVARGIFRPGLRWMNAAGQQFWRAAENVFNDYVQSGPEIVLIIRLGAYAEVDYEELVQFHFDKQCRITSVSGPDGAALGTFVISASRRNDAAYLFRHELGEMRTPCEEFQHNGYTNPLRNARDLRLLALDSFAGWTSISPRGSEIKPGVWVGENARVHRKARLLAPCFVGAYAKVRASSLLTRGSVVEHHVEIDCGTVVENSTVLPMTTIGAGLDVANSLIGFSHIWNMKRNVTVKVEDRRLVGILHGAPRRALTNAAQIAVYIPKLIARTALGRRQKAQPEFTEVPHRPAAALKSTEQVADDPIASTTNLISARRYGNE
jgi:carbonic anhydrase/acetyltransferase-like protein (isoleucine patch superfamily)